MSQTTTYTCDGCDKPIGETVHITLMLSGGSGTGIAVPTKGSSRTTWATATFHRFFLHFHTGICAAKYFDHKCAEVAVPGAKMSPKAKKS